MVRQAKAVILVGVFAMCWCAPLSALGPVKDAHVEAELVAEDTSARAGSTLTVGLRLKMDDQWHIYWKNPGDAGLAPSIRWQLPDGFEASSIQWPYPQRFEAGGLISYGYDDEVLLPVRIKVPTRWVAESVKLVAHAEWLACQEACVAGEATLDLRLPITSQAPQRDDRWQDLFTHARQRLPREPADDQVTAHRTKEFIVLRIAGLQRQDGHLPKLTFFAADADVIEYAAPQLVERDRERLGLSLLPSRHAETPATQLRGTLVVEGSGRSHAFDIDVPVGVLGEADSSKPSKVIWLLLIVMLFFAILIGVFGRWAHRHGSQRDRGRQ